MLATAHQRRHPLPVPLPVRDCWGAQGAAFANVLWMPLNAGVIQLHMKRPGKIALWFAPLSQRRADNAVLTAPRCHAP